MSARQVHIAGIGISSSSREHLDNDAIEAGTRALLDAGITYGKVQLSIACSLGDTQPRIPQACFKAFGKQKAPIGLMDSSSALYMAAHCIRNGQTDCAMLIGLDTVSKHGPETCSWDPNVASRYLQAEVAGPRRYELEFDRELSLMAKKIVDIHQIAAVAIILVTDRFLVSHAFLQDSAVRIRACTMAVADSAFRGSIESALRQATLKAGDIQMIEALGSTPSPGKNEILRSAQIGETRGLEPLKDFGATGLAGLCGIVWRLRGWVPEVGTPLHNFLQHTTTQEGQTVTVILCRSDGQSAPKFKDVQNLRDGRERLGYNPAETTKEIGWRMEGVKSREGDRMPLSGAGQLQLATRAGDRAALARL